jgi:hypothetical protein
MCTYGIKASLCKYQDLSALFFLDHRLCMEFSLSCTAYPEPVFKIIR